MRQLGRPAIDTTYTISDLAAEFGLTPRTLRWYEDEGLLRPERNGSHRVFTARDRTRLRLILRGKRLGFSLAEIREIVDMYDAAPGERGQLLTLLRRIEEHRTDLGARMHDLQRTLADLDEVEQRARHRLAELASAGD